MLNLSSLLQHMPEIPQARLVSSGIAVWVAWAKQLNPAIQQTLSDHGGMLLVQEHEQSLWLFLSNDAFRGVARLLIWARLNPMPVTVQVLPATLLSDFRLNLSMSVSPDMTGQWVVPPAEFTVWMHQGLADQIKGIPGLELRDAATPSGLTGGIWKLFYADQGLDYESLLGWYFVMKPLGNPADKSFINGWRVFFGEVQMILQKLGFKYLIKDNFVIFSIDKLRLLRMFCRDILLLLRRVKEEEAGVEDSKYWPAVMAGVSSQGLNFNEELPRKIPLEWDRLTPDFPHFQYRSAFLLGEGFRINDLGMSSRETVESWCNIRLGAESGDVAEDGMMHLSLSRKLYSGDLIECFYCGLKNHPPSQCPSRILTDWKPEIWDALAEVGLEQMEEAYASIDESLDVENLLEGIAAFRDEPGPRGLLVRAMFEINAPVQHRMFKLVWRSRGKDWPAGLSQLSNETGEYLWMAMDAINAGDMDQTEEILKQASLRYAKSYQPRSMQGVLKLEQGDLDQAIFYWQESERFSYTQFQQGFFLYLQGRIREIQGDYKEATDLYKACQGVSPKWIDPFYREAVCLVKRGFSEQAGPIFENLVDKDPHIFNRMLIDPELERGRIHLLSAMWKMWVGVEEQGKTEKDRIEKLAGEVGQWFEETHEFHDVAQKHVDRLLALSKVRNYVAFKQLSRGSARLVEEMEKRVDLEIKLVDSRVGILFERLKDVQKEASWFPFPRLLHEFNLDFNFCAEKLNWIRGQHLKVAENFRKSQKFMSEIEDRLRVLKSRLVTLRIIRDSTLFILMLGRNFIWLEILCLGLALITLPAIIFFSDRLTGLWFVDLILKQKWEFQKGLVLILSIFAVAIAAFKTALGFEKRKQELFARSTEEIAADDARQKAKEETKRAKEREKAKEKAEAKPAGDKGKDKDKSKPGKGGK
jgi:tetratricopeptide (TPR) repeat protein